MQQKQKLAKREEDCADCLYWLGGYGCALGDAPCPYAESAIEAAPNAPPGRCEDCPYGRDAPCIGWCTRDILQALANARQCRGGGRDGT